MVLSFKRNRISRCWDRLWHALHFLDSYLVSIIKMFSKKIGAWFVLYSFFLIEGVLCLYKTTICPCIEYCCHIWVSAYNCYLNIFKNGHRRCSVKKGVLKMFSFKFCEIFKNTFFKKQLWTTASVHSTKCRNGYIALLFLPVLLFFDPRLIIEIRLVSLSLW